MKLKDLFEYIDWEQIEYTQINEIDDFIITKYMLAKNTRDLISIKYRDVYCISPGDKRLIITVYKG